ncbi:MAG: hypothetical protein JJ864_07520 [Rhizobiaceae bacterium]|nr:hypothetical protein [Rhizobiaceae bacterium]
MSDEKRELEAGVYLNPMPEEKLAELIIVALNGDAIVHQLNTLEMDALAASLMREAARIRKGKTSAVPRFPVVVDNDRIVKV